MWQIIQMIMENIEHYLNYYGLRWMIRCEAIHFVTSAISGLLAFYLMLTISSHRIPDRYTYRFSLVCGLLSSVTIHIFIDYIVNPIYPLA